MRKKIGRRVYLLVDLMIDFYSKCALSEAQISSGESPKTQCWPQPDLILSENRASNPLINTPYDNFL